MPMHITTTGELAAISKNIPDPGDASITRVLQCWQFVTCGKGIILIGVRDGCGLRTTTPVVCLDVAAGIVATVSGSVHRLVGPRNGDAEFDKLYLQIAAMMHAESEKCGYT